MEKSLSIIFFLFGSISSIQGLEGRGCLSQEKGNCQVCNLNQNFILKQAKCELVKITGCSRISENGKCLGCIQGFEARVSKDQLICIFSETIPFCTERDNLGCLACERGFYLIDRRCERLERVLNNCKVHNHRGNCEECEPGFETINGKCEKPKLEDCLVLKSRNCDGKRKAPEGAEAMLKGDESLDNTKFWQIFGRTTQACIELPPPSPVVEQKKEPQPGVMPGGPVKNCAKYLIFGICASCAEGFIWVDNRCVSPFSNDGCQKFNGGACTACIDGSPPAAEICKPLSSSEQIAHCEFQNEPSRCRRCEKGFRLTDDRCVALEGEGEGRVIVKGPECAAFRMEATGLKCIREVEVEIDKLDNGESVRNFDYVEGTRPEDLALCKQRTFRFFEVVIHNYSVTENVAEKKAAGRKGQLLAHPWHCLKPIDLTNQETSTSPIETIWPGSNPHWFCDECAPGYESANCIPSGPGVVFTCSRRDQWGRCEQCENSSDCQSPLSHAMRVEKNINGKLIPAICEHGYRLVDNACQKISTGHCVYFAVDMKCLACDAGYYPLEFDCISDENPPESCEIQSASGACLDCKNGYFVRDGKCEVLMDGCEKGDQDGCRKCSEGKVLEYLKRKCVDADRPNCIELDVRGRCQVCKAGYLPGRCVLKQSDDEESIPSTHSDCLELAASNSKICIRCRDRLVPSAAGGCVDVGSLGPTKVSNCVEFFASGLCAICGAGFTLSSDHNKCSVVTQKRPFCISYMRNEKEEEICARCLRSYTLVDGRCSATYNRCAISDDKGGCLQCTAGLIIVEGKCVRSDLKPELDCAEQHPQYPICIGCVHGLKSTAACPVPAAQPVTPQPPKEPQDFCIACRAGYTLSDGQCRPGLQGCLFQKQPLLCDVCSHKYRMDSKGVCTEVPEFQNMNTRITHTPFSDFENVQSKNAAGLSNADPFTSPLSQTSRDDASSK